MSQTFARGSLEMECTTSWCLISILCYISHLHPSMFKSTEKQKKISCLCFVVLCYTQPLCSSSSACNSTALAGSVHPFVSCFAVAVVLDTMSLTCSIVIRTHCIPSPPLWLSIAFSTREKHFIEVVLLRPACYICKTMLLCYDPYTGVRSVVRV